MRFCFLAACLLSSGFSSTHAQPLPCTDGFAGPYACSELDLVAHLDLDALDASSGNDVWGWTDPQTGREYALMGLSNGTAFVDITEPANPQYLGKLPTATEPSDWRDIKVYADHAFVVSEAPDHGLQVFDLTHLRRLTSDPTRRFAATTTFRGTEERPLGNVHNLVINEATGFAYAVGARECAGGLYMINIQDPASPQFAGCFSEDGYTHDAQCVVYRGPDADYEGRELCVASNEDTVTLVDVTDKDDPTLIGKGVYPSPAYTHQGWFTEDQRYFIVDDELDEIQGFTDRTRTFVFDLQDLDSPELLTIHTSPLPAADHNLYVVGDRLYQANYTAGLRVLDLSAIAEGKLTEEASFDIYPESDAPRFNGAWSVYPFFESGALVVSGIEGGLFVLRPSSSALLSLALFDVRTDADMAFVRWAGVGNESPLALQSRHHESDAVFETLTTLAPAIESHDAEGLSPGHHDFRLLQTDPDGTIRVSPMVSVEIEGPDNYRLTRLSADPEGGTDRVALTLEAPQHVRVELVDDESRSVKVIYEDQLTEGTVHTFEVAGPALVPGLYTLRLTGETFEEEYPVERAR